MPMRAPQPERSATPATAVAAALDSYVGHAESPSHEVGFHFPFALRGSTGNTDRRYSVMAAQPAGRTGKADASAGKRARKSRASRQACLWPRARAIIFSPASCPATVSSILASTKATPLAWVKPPAIELMRTTSPLASPSHKERVLSWTHRAAL